MLFFATTTQKRIPAEIKNPKPLTEVTSIEFKPRVEPPHKPRKTFFFVFAIARGFQLELL